MWLVAFNFEPSRFLTFFILRRCFIMAFNMIFGKPIEPVINNWIDEGLSPHKIHKLLLVEYKFKISLSTLKRYKKWYITTKSGNQEESNSDSKSGQGRKKSNQGPGSTATLTLPELIRIMTHPTEYKKDYPHVVAMVQKASPNEQLKQLVAAVTTHESNEIQRAKEEAATTEININNINSQEVTYEETIEDEDFWNNDLEFARQLIEDRRL